MKTRYLPTAAIFLMFGLCCASSLRADDGNLTLNLTCSGSGVATRTETTSIRQYDPKTKKYTTANAKSMSKEPFQGIAVVEISGGMGRIMLPESLVPALNTRSDGWFTIHDLVVSPDVITGKIKINFLTSRNLRIDRHSGLLTIDGGSGNFSGQCEATDRNAPRKF
jgi:hypothetical protein